MQEPVQSAAKRIDSIDILRGLAMVVMALDHVRDYFHAAAISGDPLDLATTTPLLFMTRWVTHFCAPLFVFLSGTSIYLQGLRKSKGELSAFLFKRGLWLILMEMAVITLGWTFNPGYSYFILQVIWVIGWSMILLSLVIRLPFGLILALGLLLVFGHNLLDIPESAPGFKPGLLWDFLHKGHFSFYTLLPGHTVVILYPLLPWPGVMMLGYCLGYYFSPRFSVALRSKRLLWLGTGLLLFFTLLRFTNTYGDPVGWSTQKNALFTLLSFINVYKYPPSLLYLCLTIGTGLLLLVLFERVRGRIPSMLRVFGRVAFFYYILHLYLIHLLEAISFFMRGHSFGSGPSGGREFLFYFVIPAEGYGLRVVYLVWIAVVLALYPLCKWYDAYKSSHRHKWWLSYL